MAKDMEPVARIDANRFALIIENAQDKKESNQRLVRFIASDLMQTLGQEMQIALQFRCIYAFLLEFHLSPKQLMCSIEK